MVIPSPDRNTDTISLDAERADRRGPLSRTEFVDEVRRLHAHLEDGIAQLFYRMTSCDPVQSRWHEQVSVGAYVFEEALVAIEAEHGGSSDGSADE